MFPRNNRAAALTALAVAAVCFAAFLVLGVYVSGHGEPPALWTLDRQLRGHSIGAATFFTAAGRSYVLAPIYVALALIAVCVRSWRRPVLYLIAVALLCWGAADAFQHVFARPRRHDWLAFHESSFSYPSSHTAIAVGFYFLSGLLIVRNGASPFRIAVFVALTAFAIAIMWSRLALAAHYLTDVAGGLCLGLSIASAVAAVVLGAVLPLRERQKSYVGRGPAA